MSATLDRVRRLVAEHRVRLSDHGFERLLRHDIEYVDILSGVDDAIVVEDYPDYVHGRACLPYSMTWPGGRCTCFGVFRRKAAILR